MNDSKKTKQQLIRELEEAHQKISALTQNKSISMDDVFRKAFFTSPDMFIIANSENGTYVEVNDSFTGTTGYSREELIGRTVNDLNMWVYPEEAEKTRQLLADKGKISDEEFSFRMKSGEIRQWLCSAEIVPHGDTKYMMAVATDITERKNLETQNKYHANLFNNVSDAIVSMDMDNKLTSWNCAAERIYGWSREEVIGKNMKDTLETEYAGYSYKEIRKLILKNGYWKGEAIHKTRDGRKLNVLVSSSLINDDKSNTIGAVSIYTDITEMKRAEEERQLILKSAIDGFAIIDFKGRILDVNDSYCDMVGYTRDELLKMSIGDIEAIQSINEIRSRLVDFVHKKSELFETKHRCKDGHIIDVEVSSNLLNIDEDGQISTFVRDITKRKQAEQTLKESEEKFSKIFHSSTINVAISRIEDGCVLDINDAYAQFTGYLRKELIGRTASELNAWNDLKKRDIFIRELQKKGIVRDFEVEIRMRSGEIRTVLLTADRIQYQGEDCLINTLVDITERKRMEEAIRESQKFNTSLLENAPTQVVVIDPDTSIRYVNPKFEEENGWTLEEVVGLKAPYPWWPEDMHNEENVQQFKEALNIEFGQGEIRTRKKNGEYYWLDLQWTAAKLNRNTQYCIIHGVNVTERKNTAEALRESEEKYRTVINNANIGIIILQDNRIVFNNPWISEVFGYSEEELKNGDVTSFIHADDILMLTNWMQDRYAGKPATNAVEMRAITKAGEIIWIETRSLLVQWQGKPALQAFIVDVSERRQVEKALRDSQEKYQAVIDNANIGIIIVQDNRLVFSNPWIHKGFGYTEEQLKTIDITSFIHPDDRAAILEQLLIFMQGKYSPSPVELRILTNTGETKWISGSSVLIQWQDRPAIQSFIIDVTERKQAEEALKESEEKHRALFETMAQGALYQDAEGNIISANPAAERILDLTHNEIMGHTAYNPNWKTIREDGSDFPRKDHPAMVSLRTGKPVKDVYMGIFLLDKNEYRWITIDSVPEFRKGERKPYRVYTTFSDITERRKAQEAIRVSEEKFSKAFQASPDSIVISSLKEGRILEVNDTFQVNSGYTREEVIGKSTADLNAWSNSNDRESILRVLKRGGSVKNRELVFRNKRGEANDVLFSAELITIEGEPYIISITRDITLRKKAEEALRENEAQLQGILRAAPIGIALVQGRTAQWVNDYFCRMTGYTHKGVVGTTSRLLYLTEEEFLRVGLVRDEQIRLLGRSEIESRFKCNNGDVIDVLQVSTPLDPENHSSGTIVTIMDITERKKAQEQERETKSLRELNRLRSELLANVSHELRTPLASIKGFTTVMMDYDNKLSPQEKRDYLDIVDNNADRLSELIEQLLVMSQLGAGTLAIDKSPNSIEQLCQDILSEAKIWAPEYSFDLDIQDKLPDAHIDSRRVRQVINNLIDNSVKNSKPGTKISIAARKDRRKILVAVTDEGAGISRKDQPHVFDRMFHIDKKNKSERSGVGLGLSICKGLVEAHGGQIWIESEEGVGTRCYFTLPIYGSRRSGEIKRGKR